jgi:hypothetical protein
MKFLRGLAVLAVSVVAASLVNAPASAEPNTGVTTSAVGAGSSAAAQRLISYISNENNIGIGVSNDYDGFEDYDAILPARQRTDGYFGWEIAEAYYVGLGYCADSYYLNANWKWVFYATTHGPATIALPQFIVGQDVARWAVRDVRPRSACG